MLSERELDGYWSDHFQRTAFRLEVRDSYDVDAERGNLDRYLAGEPAPGDSSPWLDELRGDSAAGKQWQWVHVVDGPLSDYLRMALEWGYAANVRAGAEVRILDLGRRARPAGLLDEDFWLLDDEAVLLMHYDERGRFLGATEADDRDPYRRARDAAWQAAEPLGHYWRKHPEYHQKRVA